MLCIQYIITVEKAFQNCTQVLWILKIRKGIFLYFYFIGFHISSIVLYDLGHLKLKHCLKHCVVDTYSLIPGLFRRDLGCMPVNVCTDPLFHRKV